MGERTCVICGASFKAPPSSNKVTCSRPCSTARKRQSHLGKSNVWNEQSREALSARGRTSNLQLGTPAALQSPRSGPFETNVNAKTWLVAAPGGAPVYEVRNLRLWCEYHADLFAPDHWRKAYAGLKQVAAWRRGKTKRQVSQWKGWTLE